jgi:hypothetical protein
MIAAAIFAMAGSAANAQWSVREFNFHPIARQGVAHEGTHEPSGESPEMRATANSLRTAPSALDNLKLYPVAGTLGKDIFIPYFVDLDKTPFDERDFLCTDYTFDGHTGHDPYIRSFREQDLGVPIFAPLDGTVIEVHDGEPDQQTVVTPGARSNYIVLSHVSGYRTEYFHLKRNSITVRPGDTVTAGTQIGLVGSSGESAAPHAHWEVRVNNDPVEPLAGPCRPGGSMFEQQPEVSMAPAAIGIAFSDVPFSAYPLAPHDNAPRRGLFLKDSRSLNFKVEVANVRAGDTYTLTATSPGGQTFNVASGQLTAYTAYLASAHWSFDAPLNETGTWIMTLRVNGSRVVEAPFSVTASANEMVNRPPHDPSVSLEPLGLLAGEVAVCRVNGGVLADPDTDVVSYRYQWRVNDTIVRDATHAARTDALARQHLVAGSTVSCSVTASDTLRDSATITAHDDVEGPSRRRAARR